MQEMQETQIRSLGWEDPLEEGMETHSSILAWEIPWTEEPGGLQSRGSQRIGHNLATKQQQIHLLTATKWQPIPVFLPGESQGRGSLWAAVYGVAQNWTGLNRLTAAAAAVF